MDRLGKDNGRYLLTAGELRFEAEHVMVAMAIYQRRRVPQFAEFLDHRIVQLHSSDYRNPAQLRKGGVLIVGAGNSGAEIALEVARSHPTWVSGRDTGHLPFRIEGVASRLLLAPIALRFVFHRVLTVNTRIGRKVRPKVLFHGGPLIRVKPKALAGAGIQRVPKTIGVQDGLPRLEDGRVLDVANVIWCTGYHPGFAWIDLPVFGEDGQPVHHRGVVTNQSGLYFVGLHFLYALSSTMIHGVGRDAEHIAGVIAARSRGASTSEKLLHRATHMHAPSR